MLKGAFSNLSLPGKFVLLLLMQVCFLVFSTLTGVLFLVPFYGTDIFRLIASPDYADNSMINALKFLQIMNNVFGMLVPALLFAWLCTGDMASYTGLSTPASLVLAVVTILVIFSAQPLIGLSSEINSRMILPKTFSSLESWMQRSEEQAKVLTEAFLKTTSIRGLILNIIIIAVLPSFTEEFLFRGVLASLFRDLTRNIHFAVFISSFIFAAIHMQFYGFLPRFLLGMVLGYLFFWSGSLWLPVTAHFVNNLLSVILEFLYHKHLINSGSEDFGNHSSYFLYIISAVSVFSLLVFIWYKKKPIPEVEKSIRNE